MSIPIEKMTKQKPNFDFNLFLQELDSRKEINPYNIINYISNYTLEEKDTQKVNYEIISFYSIDNLEKLLENNYWIDKRDEYKLYLLNRVTTTNNNIIKAQYLTILAKCFKTQIEEAMKSLRDILTELLINEKYKCTTKLLFINLLQVAFLSKGNREQLYQFFSDTINRKDISNDNLMFFLNLLTSNNGKQIHFTKISGIFDVCISLVTKFKDPQKRKKIIEISLFIFEKLNNEDKYIYANKKKELYELLADNEYSFLIMDDPKNAAIPHYNHMFLRNIVQWYSLAGNNVKAAKAEKQLIEVKAKLQFPPIPITIYTPEDVKLLDHKIELAYNCPASLFLFWLSDNFFRSIPSENNLNKELEKFKGPEGFSFSHLDYNYNIKDIPETDETFYKKIFIYNLFVIPARNNFLSVFLCRLKEGTIIYKDIYDFLTKDTNFGEKFLSYQHENLSFYEVVEKGLKHLFFNLKKYANGNISDFTLSIDSLSSKIERILREMLHLINASVLKVDAKNAKVKKETMILLDQILNAPELHNIMTDDDINFFKYVLTNNGLNIRNDSAHGFYDPIFYKSDSGLIAGFMIFVCILRLAVISNSFQFEESEKES